MDAANDDASGITRTVSQQLRSLYSRRDEDGNNVTFSLIYICFRVSCTCITFLISYGIMWCMLLAGMVIAFRLSAKSPNFYLSNFSISPVTANNSAAAAGFIACQFDIHNRATLVDAHYDEFLVSVTHKTADGAKVTSDIQSFHQEPYGVDRRKANIQLPGDFVLQRGAAAGKLASGQAEEFHVGLETKFRYMSLWRSGRHEVNVGADVQVGADGKMLAQEKILLRSSAALRAVRSVAAAATTSITVLLFLI